jgi:hypothetical protein
MSNYLPSDPHSVFETAADLGLDGAPRDRRSVQYSLSTTRFVESARSLLSTQASPVGFVAELTRRADMSGLVPAKDPESLARYFHRYSALFKVDDSTFRPSPGDLVFFGASSPWLASRVGVVEAREAFPWLVVIAPGAQESTIRRERASIKPIDVRQGHRVIGFARPNFGGAYRPVSIALASLNTDAQLGFCLMREGYTGDVMPTVESPAMDAALSKFARAHWLPKHINMYQAAVDYYGLHSPVYTVDDLAPGMFETSVYWVQDSLIRPKIDIADFQYGIRGSSSVRHLQAVLRRRGFAVELTGHFFDDTLSAVRDSYAWETKTLTAYRREFFPRYRYRLIDTRKDT